MGNGRRAEEDVVALRTARARALGMLQPSRGLICSVQHRYVVIGIGKMNERNEPK